MKTNRYYEKYHWLIRLFFLTGLIISGMIPNAHAQLLLGSRGTSMGQAVTALPHDIWNVFANPALLPEKGRAVSFYGIRYYGFTELTDVALAGHYTHKFGNFAIGAHSFGDELYRESRFRVAYSREYQGIRAGIAVNYSHISIERYGSAGAAVFDAGLAYELTQGLWVGSRATNLSQSKIGQAGEELPRELALGFSYQLSDRATFSADLVKDSRFPLSYRAGLEARIIYNLFIRGGVTTEPLTYSAGMGFAQRRWGINIVAQQHYVLGWNPGFDFYISF